MEGEGDCPLNLVGVETSLNKFLQSLLRVLIRGEDTAGRTDRLNLRGYAEAAWSGTTLLAGSWPANHRASRSIATTRLAIPVARR